MASPPATSRIENINFPSTSIPQMLTPSPSPHHKVQQQRLSNNRSKTRVQRTLTDLRQLCEDSRHGREDISARTYTLNSPQYQELKHRIVRDKCLNDFWEYRLKVCFWPSKKQLVVMPSGGHQAGERLVIDAYDKVKNTILPTLPTESSARVSQVFDLLVWHGSASWYLPANANERPAEVQNDVAYVPTRRTYNADGTLNIRPLCPGLPVEIGFAQSIDDIEEKMANIFELAKECCRKGIGFDFPYKKKDGKKVEVRLYRPKPTYLIYGLTKDLDDLWEMKRIVLRDEEGNIQATEVYWFLEDYISRKLIQEIGLTAEERKIRFSMKTEDICREFDAWAKADKEAKAKGSKGYHTEQTVSQEKEQEELRRDYNRRVAEMEAEAGGKRAAKKSEKEARRAAVPSQNLAPGSRVARSESRVTRSMSAASRSSSRQSRRLRNEPVEYVSGLP